MVRNSLPSHYHHTTSCQRLQFPQQKSQFVSSYSVPFTTEYANQTSSELTQTDNAEFTLTCIPPIIFGRLKMVYQVLLSNQYFENSVTFVGREDIKC